MNLFAYLVFWMWMEERGTVRKRELVTVLGTYNPSKYKPSKYSLFLRNHGDISPEM